MGIQLISLMVSLASLIVAILTYLRVTRKYLSKTVHFQQEIKPKKEMTLFNIEGTGAFQRLEMTTKGSVHSPITLLLDDEVYLQETFHSLSLKSSRYITKFILPNPQSPKGEFAVEIDLQRKFFKNLKFSVTNEHDSIPMQIKGIVHYSIFEN